MVCILPHYSNLINPILFNCRWICGDLWLKGIVCSFIPQTFWIRHSEWYVFSAETDINLTLKRCMATHTLNSSNLKNAETNPPYWVDTKIIVNIASKYNSAILKRMGGVLRKRGWKGNHWRTLCSPASKPETRTWGRLKSRKQQGGTREGERRGKSQ